MDQYCVVPYHSSHFAQHAKVISSCHLTFFISTCRPNVVKQHWIKKKRLSFMSHLLCCSLLVWMQFAMTKTGRDIFLNMLHSASNSILWSLLTWYVDSNFLVQTVISYFCHLGTCADGHKYLSFKKINCFDVIRMVQESVICKSQILVCLPLWHQIFEERICKNSPYFHHSRP